MPLTRNQTQVRNQPRRCFDNVLAQRVENPRIDRAQWLIIEGDIVQACRVMGERLTELPPQDRDGFAVGRARSVLKGTPVRDRHLDCVRDL
jgi:hypothetical protein